MGLIIIEEDRTVCNSPTTREALLDRYAEELSEGIMLVPEGTKITYIPDECKDTVKINYKE